MTQANPLLEYAQTRNAEAFAAVIQQYQRFVFATCRRKLHDPADLDDAVQETFLRLAQKAGELHSNVGGWLHRCAVNVALDLNRRHEARKRHESTAASYRHEPIDDAQQTLAELREQIDAALEKLSDDQRELIVQRYFVGRAQVELAAEAGVTPSAITHRLDRAIEALRSHLSQSGFSPAVAAGGAAAVERLLQAESASANVPAQLTANLMKIGLGGVTSAAATGLGIGILAKAFLSLAAALLVGTGLWLAMSGQVSQTATNSATAAPSTQALTGPTTGPAAFTVRNQVFDNPDAQSPQWRATTQPAGAAHAVFAGRVLDRQGNPIAGAVVGIYGTFGTGMSSRPSNTATTDAQGQFVFDQVARQGEYRVGVEAAGMLPVDAYTQPNLELSSQSQARRDFVMERGVEITVNVLNSTAQPMRGAGVDITLPGDPTRDSAIRRKQTDDLGQVHAILPVSKNSYVVAASMDGYGPVHQMITPESADKPLEIGLILLRGFDVEGVAICNDGKPATGWAIYAKPDWWSSNFYPSPAAAIDAQGKFTLKNISPGAYSLYLSKKGTSYPIATATLPPADGQPLKLSIPEPSPSTLATLSGRVTFVGGPPPDEGIIIFATSLAGDGASYSTMIQNPSIRSRGRDPNAFTLNDIPPGSYCITFEATGIETKTIERFDIPGELPPVELKIMGKLQLGGTVVDASTGQPIPHFAFRVKKVRTIGNGPNYVQEGRWTQISNPQGSFKVDAVGPGVYQVQASADGYVWVWSPEITIEAGKPGNVQVRLTGGGTLSGRVMGLNGKPVAGAKIIALSMTKSLLGYRDHFEGDAGAVSTDEQGKFMLPHLAAGSETIKVIHGDFAPEVFGNLKIFENQTTDAGDLQLHIGGTAEGTFYNSKGEAVAGQRLYLQDNYGYNGDEQAGRIATTVCDEAGHFKIEHLPLQTIYIQIADKSNPDGVIQRTIHPVDGKIAHVDFGGKTPVTGRLLSLKHQPISNCKVELAIASPYFGPVQVWSKTDADGRFSFQGAPAGRYTFYCQRESRSSDWTVVRSSVDVPAQGADLGNIVNDVGDVAIHLSSDDPGDAKPLHSVYVETDLPQSEFQEQIAQAGPDGKSDTDWIARNVPAGKYRVHMTGPKPGVIHYFSFERKAEVESTQVEIHLPTASAALRVHLTHPLNSTTTALAIQGGQPVWSGFINLSKAEPQEFQLPVGTYSILDRSTMRPRADIPPVTLGANESKEIEIDPSAPNTSTSMRRLNVRAWDSTGLLLVGTIQITDRAGKPIASVTEGTLGTVFVLAPSHYEAAIDCPGLPAGHCEFDVTELNGAEPSTTPAMGDPRVIDLFVK